MKRFSVFLTVSLVANLLLAAAWWTSSLPSDSSSSAPAEAIPSPANAPSAVTSADVDPDALTPAIWAEISDGIDDSPSSDPALIARLRAAGFSPEVLRAVVRARITARYDQQEASLIASQPPLAYWSSAVTFQGHNAKDVRAQLRQMHLEKERLFTQLLGPDADSPSDIRNRERRYGSIDRLKAIELEAIVADYRDLENEIHGQSMGRVTTEDREARELLVAERERDIAALLTPEEYADYQQRAGTTARSLQSRIAEFNPTREEYQSLYDLQSAFDAKWGTYTAGLDREQRSARTAAQKQLEADLTAALGSERYAEYETLTSSDYRGLKQLTDMLELPAENAVTASTLRQEVNTASRAIQRDRELSPEQKSAQLTALSESSRRQLQELLTADGLEAYSNSPYGRWLNYIVPPPRPAPRP